jgi:uncharacterized membrane protein YdjX (TVP38/TMEM64 family)
LIGKTLKHLKALGNLTPIALLSAFLPMAGSLTLIAVSYPLSTWLRENWEIGSVLFLAGVLVFCGFSLLPPNLIGILSGWAFGFGAGLGLLMAGLVGSAFIAYLISAKIAGERLPEVVRTNPKADAIYKVLVQDDKNRLLLIVVLLRMAFAPFALANFIMASAKVPLWIFLGGTAIGMLPRSAAMVVAGARLSEFSLERPSETWPALLAVGAAVLVAIVIARASRSALTKLTSGL